MMYNLKHKIMITEKESLKIIRYHLDNLQYNYNYYPAKMNEIRNGLTREENFHKIK